MRIGVRKCRHARFCLPAQSRSDAAEDLDARSLLTCLPVREDGGVEPGQRVPHGGKPDLAEDVPLAGRGVKNPRESEAVALPRVVHRVLVLRDRHEHPVEVDVIAPKVARRVGRGADPQVYIYRRRQFASVKCSALTNIVHQ